MERKTSLSIDTISSAGCYVNFNPYFDAAVLDQSISFSTSFDVSDEASLIEMDPQMPPSRRFYRVSNDFSIDFQSPFPPSPPPDHPFDLDACFLLPIFVQQLSMAERPQDHDNDTDTDTGSSFLTPPRSILLLSSPSEEFSSSDDIPCGSLRRCRRILHKYLGFFRPLCRKLRCRRRQGSGYKVASITSTPTISSPVARAVCFANKSVNGSCGSEFCIHDAVLHCRRTNGNGMFLSRPGFGPFPTFYK